MRGRGRGGRGSAGKRPGRDHHGSRPPFKKAKRSKAFWQQRKTVEMAPAPKDDDRSETSSSEEDGELIKSNYDTLLQAFPASRQISKSSDDDESTGGEASSDADISDANDSDRADDEDNATENLNEDDEEKDEEDGDDQLENDPFLARVGPEIPEDLQTKIANKNCMKQCVTWPNLGKVISQCPKWTTQKDETQKCLLDDEDQDGNSEKQLKLQEFQEKLVNVSLAEPIKDYFLTDQLSNNLAVANASNMKESKLVQPLNGHQSELLSLLATYKDVYFGQETLKNLEEVRLVYCAHALNHMLKTRNKILKNNAKLSKNPGKSAIDVRDQGLCRPKIVIVVPFKESARKIVEIMGKLMFGEVKRGNVSNKKRFDDEFGTEPKDLDKIKASGHKPDDFYETFCGDTDDGFKMGIAVTKKTLKLYADFYSSDIIVASPLGLRMVVGVDGESKRDYDFLTSIEMLIIDQMDVLAMQNWDHISHIFEHMHLQPSQSHGVDFSRVRMWGLNGLSKFYRQTIMFSSMVVPEIQAIMNKDCSNYCGNVRFNNPYPVGGISGVSTSVPIVFHRFDSNSATRSVDDRFDYFVNRVMPDFKKDLMYHTCIFVPSYFDFVRVRNWSNGCDLDLAEISEYSKDKNVAAARDHFFHGEKHFLLYSERAHFYRRFTIKGIRHLIFYQLPSQSPKFFAELCNFMHFQNKKAGSDGNMTCTVVYCKYDIHRLAPVVGTDTAQTMLTSAKSVHMFSPGAGATDSGLA